jgi:hypothetical protein
MVVFDGDDSHAGLAPLDDTNFTVRWMASQLQGNRLDKLGFWSWMDGTLTPLTTYREDKAEALTIAAAVFSGGGWLDSSAFPRRNGASLLRSAM